MGINDLMKGKDMIPKDMTPIDGCPGLYKTNVFLPGPKKMRRFKAELIRNASTPAMVRVLEKALSDL